MNYLTLVRSNNVVKSEIIRMKELRTLYEQQ